MMPEVVIVDAVRTAIGRRKGSLSNMHPVDLLVPVLQALVQRNGIEAGSVEDVVVGVDQLHMCPHGVLLSSRFRIFPAALRGSAVTVRYCLGTLNPASRSRR